MSKTRKVYSADFKAKVVLELIQAEQTLNQIASKYDVTPQSLLSWKKQFLENASQASQSSKMSLEYKKEIEELQTTNDKLAKALGNTTIERDFALKKQNSPQKAKALLGTPSASLDLIDLFHNPKKQVQNLL